MLSLALPAQPNTVLASPREGDFDRLTKLAVRVVGATAGLISLFDGQDRDRERRRRRLDVPRAAAPSPPSRLRTSLGRDQPLPVARTRDHGVACLSRLPDRHAERDRRRLGPLRELGGELGAELFDVDAVSARHEQAEP